ncbi:MAG: ParA family protein [Solirubrobacterales bacterium]|jgi:chromosome partitioning protein|nr:ParA family protein [Solirubrobacterales bacterium]
MGLFNRGTRSDEYRPAGQNGSPVNEDDAAAAAEPPEPVFEEPAYEGPVAEQPAAEPAAGDPSAGKATAEEGEAERPAAENRDPEPKPERAAERAPANPPSEPEPSEEMRITASQAIKPTRKPAPPATGEETEEPQRRAQVISFANQKGGVAKTTTTLNLAVAFAESGHDVLCVDLDPQGNLTMSQGIDPDKVNKSMFDVLVHHDPIRDVIEEREIDIAVSSIDLAGAEIAMSMQIGRERSLEKALAAVTDDYDFICIDTPPSLGLLTINALTASDKVIVPVQCEYLSMRGLLQLQNTLEMIQENLNPRVKIEGILPTMLDSRTVHAKEAVEILEENFGELVFKSRIRKAIKFAEAPVRGASVLKYDPKGNAADYYRALAQEVLTNGAS